MLENTGHTRKHIQMKTHSTKTSSGQFGLSRESLPTLSTLPLCSRSEPSSDREVSPQDTRPGAQEPQAKPGLWKGITAKPKQTGLRRCSGQGEGCIQALSLSWQPWGSQPALHESTIRLSWEEAAAVSMRIALVVEFMGLLPSCFTGLQQSHSTCYEKLLK